MGSRAAFAALVVGLSFAIYAPLRDAGFLWDDVPWIAQNRLVQSPDGLATIWTDLLAMPHYYPVVATSFWLEYRLFGQWAGGYHLVNVALHALNALLLVALLRRLGVPGAPLAGLLFAVHPMNAESVAWIVERKNLYAAAFSLAAALAFLAALDPARPRRLGVRPVWVVSFLLFLCALLSKTTACTLPPALALLLAWKRRLDREAVVSLLPFLALAVETGLVTSFLERDHLFTFGPDWSFSFAERILIAGRALWFYVGRFLWPSDLMFVYPRWTLDVGSLAQWAWPAAAFAVAPALYALRGRLGLGPLVAALYYGGASFPTLGFVNFFFMLHSFVSDHFPYLPSFALVALAGAAAARLAARYRLRPAALAASSALLLLPLAVQTARYAPVFSSDESVWRDSLRKNPDSWLALVHVGMADSRGGRIAEAEARLQRALALRPLSEHALNGMSVVRLQQARPAEAEQFARRALDRRPGLLHARLNLALALLRQGRVAEAEPALERALLDPNEARLNLNVGSLLANEGAYEAAIPRFERALALDPANSLARENLARARSMLGR
jgi:tetratricopeptide (TPR) repeat protein